MTNAESTSEKPKASQECTTEEWWLELVKQNLSAFSHKLEVVTCDSGSEHYTLDLPDNFLEFSWQQEEQKLLILKQAGHSVKGDCLLYLSPRANVQQVKESLKAFLDFFDVWEPTEIREKLEKDCFTGMLVSYYGRSNAEMIPFVHQ